MTLHDGNLWSLGWYFWELSLLSNPIVMFSAIIPKSQYSQLIDMKLIRFGPKGKEKPGVLIHEKRLDCSAHFQDWNRAFFNSGGLDELKKLIEEKGQTLAVVEESARWGSPIAQPNMIMCVGLNYADHAKEAGMDIPQEPVLFMKAANTIAGAYDAVRIPKGSTKTDWEVELGIIIGQDISYAESDEQARAAIAGYAVVHDISERAFQIEQGGQWVKGKSCPGFCPLGPWLATPDEIEEVGSLAMRLSVNGQTMQDGSTRTMIFDPVYVVKYISQYMLLEAGDLISTGTPPGVGLGMNPPIYLKRGDEVVLSIDGLGEQRQLFV